MRLGVMCSGNGTNFENIVRTCTKDEVVLMIHNKKECGAKKRAAKLGIPHCHIKSKNEAQIIQLFNAWRVDLIVLAGWMKVISPQLINAFPDRIINIHPSLLPSFPGINAIEQALTGKVCITGCSVHLVRQQVDNGPILIQAAVPVLDSDDKITLSKRIQVQEHRILPIGISIAGKKWRGIST